MKSSTKKIIVILLISLILLSLTRFVFDIFKLKEYIYALILGLTLGFSILFLGYTRNRNSREKNMSIAMLVFTLLFQVLTFVLFGWGLGFLSSSYHPGFSHLFKIVLPLLLMIILSEILRYQMVEKGRNSKLSLVILTTFFVFLDILVGSSLYSLNTFKGLFELTSFIIFPSIMKNILLTYIAYHYGYKPNLIYRFVMEIPIYYLPLVPDMGDYLTCVLNIVFPFALLMYIVSYTNNIEFSPKEDEDKKENKTVYTLNIIFIIILLIFVCLMSGIFKYYFLVVGSGSMEPNIKVGDIVLVEKTKKYNDLKVNDILVYKNGDRVVIHRIIDVKKDDGKLIFKTKGDNNNAPDNFDIYTKDVIGTVNFKIAKIGYPTIWLNKLFKGGN